jgi:penicillin-binding protein 1A
MPKNVQKKTKPKKTKKFFKKKSSGKILFNLLIVCAFFACVIGITLAYILKDLPNVEKLNAKPLTPQVTIMDERGEILAKYGDYVADPLTFSQIPTPLIQALIATEDRRFYEHNGIDFLGLIRASFKNLIKGRVVEGGSTISQQLAKMLYLSPKKTYARKIQEAVLAIELERRFSKEQILSMYLNRVYLGKGNYGIDAASRYYFGKSATDIGYFESAILIGMLKAPSKYTPSNSKELAISRAHQVLGLMVESGYISAQKASALKPPEIIERGIGRGALANPYFADYILHEASDIIKTVDQNVYIFTTLDINAQHSLEHIIESYKEKMAKYNVNQVAAVLLDENGAVKAMVGGISYKSSQYNRATSAKRQAGSAFKYFVYLAALEYGLYPQDTFVDKPISISLGKNKTAWKPRNFSRDYKGSMSIEQAFAYSINTIAVQINEQIGRTKTIDMAKRLGIEEDILNVPSIALGVTEVTPLEMARAYAHIANEGFAVHTFGITKILNEEERVLFRYEPSFSEKLLSDEIVEKMKSLMEAVVSYGNGKRAALDYTTVYGKTGTTSDHKDSWFIGINNGYTLAIWMGNDDASPAKGLVGGLLPAQIFHDFFSHVTDIRPTKIESHSSTWQFFQNVFDSAPQDTQE